jgi:hypothetical protein
MVESLKSQNEAPSDPILSPDHVARAVSRRGSSRSGALGRGRTRHAATTARAGRLPHHRRPCVCRPGSNAANGTRSTCATITFLGEQQDTTDREAAAILVAGQMTETPWFCPSAADG